MLSEPGTSANSEDPDVMSQKSAFHQGLHCFLRKNRSSEKDIYRFGNYNL